MEADAYATAIFTAGFEKGAALAASLPVQMLLISSENKMYKTPDFAAEFFQ
jgi:thiamine biosynthesis lipoprotein ApbE